MYRIIIIIILTFGASACAMTGTSPSVGPPDGVAARTNASAAPMRYINAKWYDDDGAIRFAAGERCQVNGIFVERCPPDAEIQDLNGAFVIPALGDAHNHNLDGPWSAQRGDAYLANGVFYMRNLNSVLSVDAWAAEAWETADTVDIAWAHAGLSSDEGHPETLYRNIAGVYGLDPEELDGDVFWDVSSVVMLEEKWPLILATDPDWIKLFLMFIEDEGKERLAGLDRETFARAVALSHEAGLSTIVHVNTALDFAEAIRLGADGAAHLPPMSIRDDEDDDTYRLTPAIARRAAAAGFVTTPTVALIEADASGSSPSAASIIDRTRRLQAENLAMLRAAGAPLALGSDLYEGDAIDELFALEGRDIYTDEELLRIAVETPRLAIFPDRAIGTLLPGWEASFLALPCDPTVDINCVKRISLRIKQGVRVGQ